jgi:indole-3-glycerol phosphate synthase
MRLADALMQPGLQAIAEVKRRSPSAGVLRIDADPAVLATQFAGAGAAAISVLVDERFGGTVDDLRAARSATDAPLLGKGFFSTEAQIDELRDAGADAVLLILRDLDDVTAARLLAYAQSSGLDALVEAHTDDELQRALALDAPIVGVNARDLDTFASSSSSHAPQAAIASSSPRAACTRARRALRRSSQAPTRSSSARR